MKPHQLLDEVETLREENRQLRGLLAPPAVQVPEAWRLTGKEADVFRCLASREVASQEALMCFLYSDRNAPPDATILRVFISQMRRKLKAFGIGIENVRGVGYRLAASGTGGAR